MRNILNNIATVVISNARAALRLGKAEGNAREAIALNLFNQVADENGVVTGDVDAVAKSIGAAERAVIEKKIGKEADVLKSAKDILKARLSESKALVAGYVAGVAECVGFFTFTDGAHTPTNTATEALTAARTAAKGGTKGEGEGETTEGEGNTVTEFTPEQFRTALSALLAGAQKSGFLADALGIMAEVGQAVATEV